MPYYRRGSNWDNQMSRVLGNKLKPLNIESLEITTPLLDSIDDSKFEELYEAISNSKLKSLIIRVPFVRVRNERPTEYTLPLIGIEQLALSKELKNLELQYTYGNTASHIFSGIPENLNSLTVSLL